MTEEIPLSPLSAATVQNDAKAPASDGTPPAAAPVAGIGALGAGVIGGALAAVIGIAIVGPLLRRRKAKKATKPATARRSRRGSRPADES